VYLDGKISPISNFEHAAVSIRKNIENKITRSGILCRVFSRGKSSNSLEKKLRVKNEDGFLKYSIGGKEIQDAIGIRIVLYFSDDIEVVRDIVSRHYLLREADSTIDKPGGSEFSVTRYNLIYELSEDDYSSLYDEIQDRPIDKTFELQIRTVLSEGWHEVEHDLRYKNRSFWDGADDFSRALNGIVATLETSEWGMKKIFEDLSHKHYKNKNWAAMLILRLRMRIDGKIEHYIDELFSGDLDLAKKFYRMDRSFIIKSFEYTGFPVSVSNAIYIWNYLFVKNDIILDQTPKLLREKLKDYP
jgi:ppGpp synthetase/RelA/SpoT-type nucleotidyltranferase